jgi:hypothetical protein
MDATEVLSKMYASHHADDSGVMGVDVESENNGLLDAHGAGIFDVLSAKSQAIRLATETAITVLRVDQVRPCHPPCVPVHNSIIETDIICALFLIADHVQACRRTCCTQEAATTLGRGLTAGHYPGARTMRQWCMIVFFFTVIPPLMQ